MVKKSSTNAIPDEFKSDQMANSIPIGRAAILKEFYAVLLASMKKEAKSGKLTQAQLNKAFETSIKVYAEQLASDAESIRAEAVIKEMK